MRNTIMIPTNPVHAKYVNDHKNVVCLQPHHIPFSDALWNTKWGAVTLDRAIELDALPKPIPPTQPWTMYWGEYSHDEDRFIDAHGCSMMLD